MKALIFTTHTGGGHDAAAHAVAEALTEQGVACRVMDCVAFGGAWLSRAVSGTYVKMVQRHPDGFGRIYHLGDLISTPRMKSPVYYANAAYAFRMASFIRAEKPDLIVCTHMFGGQSVTYLRKHGQYDGLFAMVMTDYTLSPFMEDIQPDVLCVSHRAMLPECRAKHMPEGILRPMGIPVSLSCRPCLDKAAAKQAAGLDPAGREVLLVGGSMGAGHLPETIGMLLPALSGDGHLTVVCGSNEKARQEAESHYAGDGRVTVLGKVQPLYGLMAASDVVVTKSGGLTSTEAMTIGVPMVIAHPIVGCETANADFFCRYGLADWARTPEELPGKVARLLEDADARERMIAAQRREIDPECSRHFASCLIDMVQARSGASER